MLNDNALEKIAHPAGRIELEDSLAEHLNVITQPSTHMSGWAVWSRLVS